MRIFWKILLSFLLLVTLACKEVKEEEPEEVNDFKCLASEHIEGNYCVSNSRHCYVRNGRGTQYWTNGSWGECLAIVCDENNYFINGECLFCGRDQHFEGNVCLNNQKECSIENGIGSQTWNTEMENWNNCSPVSCNRNARLENGQCIACGMDEHFENTECVVNSRQCEINHGTGTQVWSFDLSAWSPCSITSCESNFKLYQGSCITCQPNEHFEGYVCVQNSKSCSVSHGRGTQSWNDSTLSWSSCSEIACDPTYKLVNGECKRCSTDEHFEGAECVRNIKNCSISHGTGFQTWSPQTNNWVSCIPTSCELNYKLVNNECLTCQSDEHFEGVVCVNNTKMCLIENGFGYQHWDLTVNQWNLCSEIECDEGALFVDGQCKKCNADQHFEGTDCISDLKECPMTNGKGEQTWRKDLLDWGACLVKECDVDYINNNGGCEFCGENKHSEGNVCVSDLKDCSPLHGVGKQTWDHDLKVWSSCSIVCNSGYRESNGLCLSTLTTSSTDIKLVKNEIYSFSVQGGVPPYSFLIQSGVGQILPQGKYLSEVVGTSMVRISDRDGNYIRVNISINPELIVEEPNVSLKAEESSLMIPSGGFPPYTISIISGPGSINGNVFQSEKITGTSIVSVRDSANHAVNVTFNVWTDEAKSLEIISGDGQILPRQFQSPIPLVIKVKDTYGNPVRNKSVQFSIIEGNVLLSAQTCISNDSGEASVLVTSFSDIGTVIVLADIPSDPGLIPVEFNLTVESF